MSSETAEENNYDEFFRLWFIKAQLWLQISWLKKSY